MGNNTFILAYNLLINNPSDPSSKIALHTECNTIAPFFLRETESGYNLMEKATEDMDSSPSFAIILCPRLNNLRQIFHPNKYQKLPASKMSGVNKKTSQVPPSPLILQCGSPLSYKILCLSQLPCTR